MYAIEPDRSTCVLGEPVGLSLAVTATREERLPLFDHPSLALSLERPGAPVEERRRHWFPNCWAIERHDESGGHTLTRYTTGADAVLLRAGERRETSLDTAEGPLRAPLLDVGVARFAMRVTLESGEEREASARTDLRILSGPGAVPTLVALLSSEEFAVRHRAIGLLRRMTGFEAGFDPLDEPPLQARPIAAWTRFWQEVGSALPWRLDAAGVSFERDPPPCDPTVAKRAGSRLGGLVRRRVPIDGRVRRELGRHLDRWLGAPTRHPLERSTGAVAAWDELGWLPSGTDVAELDGKLLHDIERVLRRLAEEVARWEDRAGDALRFLEAIRRAPAAELVPALRELGLALPLDGIYDAPRCALAELLDVLDPARVPLGEP